jgi:hypothetical protein
VPHASQLSARHITQNSKVKGLSSVRRAWLNAAGMELPSEAAATDALFPTGCAASAVRLHPSREKR